MHACYAETSGTALKRLFVASVCQVWIFSDSCTCCHTEMEFADLTFYLTQSQYTDTRPTTPSADSINSASDW